MAHRVDDDEVREAVHQREHEVQASRADLEKLDPGEGASSQPLEDPHAEAVVSEEQVPKPATSRRRAAASPATRGASSLPVSSRIIATTCGVARSTRGRILLPVLVRALDLDHDDLSRHAPKVREENEQVVEADDSRAASSTRAWISSSSGGVHPSGTASRCPEGGPLHSGDEHESVVGRSGVEVVEDGDRSVGQVLDLHFRRPVLLL